MKNINDDNISTTSSNNDNNNNEKWRKIFTWLLVNVACVTMSRKNQDV